MKLILGLALFTFAAMPFVFGGYQLGELHGVEEAKRVVAVEREYHDNLMRELGVCEWADEFAKQVQCHARSKE